MCLICIDFQRGSLTAVEAYRNLEEMKETLTDEHQDEIMAMISEKIFDLAEEEDTTTHREIWDFMKETSEDQRQMSFEWDEWDDLTNFGEEPDWLPPFED